MLPLLWLQVKVQIPTIDVDVVQVAKAEHDKDLGDEAHILLKLPWLMLNLSSGTFTPTSYIESTN